MRILLSPIVSEWSKVEYEFDGEIIKAVYTDIPSGETYEDTFDFTGMPDGRLESVESDLPKDVILSAEKKNGVLSVELVNYIDFDATDEEKYPSWQEVN